MRQFLKVLFVFTTISLLSVTLLAQGRSSLSEGQQINLTDVMTQLSPEQASQLKLLYEASKEDDKSYFSQIRKQIQNLQIQDQVKAQKRGILLNSAIHLTPTKMHFHIIDGAIIFRTIMNQHNANPMAMVHHLEQTFDPTAWISFYAFTVSQGYYIDFRSKNLSPALKARAMTGLMYQGMMVGSLVSSITADTLILFQDCVSARLSNKAAHEIDQKCNTTLAQWTVKKKANQYGSQLVNLLAGQYGSEFVERLVKKGASTQYAQKLLKTSEKAALKATNWVLKMRKMELLVHLTPMGWEAAGFKYLFTVAKFTNFLVVDHFVSPLFMRVGNNLMHRVTTANLISDIEKIASSLSINKWRFNQSSQNSEHLNQLPEKILEMTDLLNDWRFNLNSENEEQLELWAETNKQTAHQMKYARDFYSHFNEVLKSKHEDNRTDYFPEISLPLFGVRTEFDNQDRKDINEYLLRPRQMTLAQSDKIKSIALKYLNNQNFFSDDATADNQFIKTVLTNLASGDVQKQSRQLSEINRYLNRFIDSKSQVHTYRPYGPKAHNFLTKLMSQAELGQPYPIQDKMLSYSYAYSINDVNTLIDKTAKFPLSTSNLYLHNSPLFLMYSMLCGPSQTSITADEAKFSGFYLMFPTIVQNNKHIDICQVYKRNGSDYLRKNQLNTLSTQDLLSYKVNNQSILDYLTQPTNLVADYYDPRAATDNYSTWWSKIESSFIQQMNKFDDRKKFYVDNTYNAFIGLKTFAGWLADKISNLDPDETSKKSVYQKLGNDYLPSNIRDSLLQELKIYSLIFENIQHLSTGRYETLNKEFIKKIKVDLAQTTDKKLLFPEISDAQTDFLKLKKQIETSQIITTDFVETINVHLASQEAKDSQAESVEIYKNTSDYIKKNTNNFQELLSTYMLLMRYYTQQINKQPKLLNMVKESLALQKLSSELIELQRKSAPTKADPVQSFIDLITQFSLEADFLKAVGFVDQQLYFKSLKTTEKIFAHTQIRLGYLKIQLRKNKSNESLAHKFMISTQAIEKLNHIAFPLLKNEIFNLMQLFSMAKVDFQSIEAISKNIDLFGQIAFGDMYQMEADDYEKQADDLSSEVKLVYALVNGVKSVVQNTKRYVSLRVSTESTYKMSQKDVESVTQSMNSNVNMSRNNGHSIKTNE